MNNSETAKIIFLNLLFLAGEGCVISAIMSVSN